MSSNTQSTTTARPIVAVRALKPADRANIEPILREHVRDPVTGSVIEAEVASILGYMNGAPDTEGRHRRYLVAADPHGWLIGCVAIGTPDKRMREHFGIRAENSRELLNAFVASSHFRGKGVGRALFEAACAAARDEGATELVLNSGPRYKDSWGLYDKTCDSSAGFIKDYFGPGRDAKTWRKDLRAGR